MQITDGLGCKLTDCEPNHFSPFFGGGALLEAPVVFDNTFQVHQFEFYATHHLLRRTELSAGCKGQSPYWTSELDMTTAIEIRDTKIRTSPKIMIL